MQKRIRRAPDLSARDERKKAQAAAKRAKLHYVDDSTAGIRREEHGRSFRYVGSSGRPITDRKTLDRIRGLVIPPAWTEVWICRDPNGHLQVTGHDVNGRKQYRYHPRWREVRDENKYGRLINSDVNEYLQNVRGDDFSAKDFRTWARTALAAEALKDFEDFDTKTAAKRNVTRAIERVAERLGNTKAVCRKCYVHPAIVDAFMDRSLLETLKSRAETKLRRGVSRLPAEEAAVLALLQQRMKQAIKREAGTRARRARR
jgi:DNA topoisomerase IB